MIALVFSPMPHTKSIGWQIYLWPIQQFCPTTRRNIPMLLLCFSTAAAAAPPSASHPRRPRLDAAAWAAENGHAAVVEQLISAGATVDAATNDGRGPGRFFGSFWEWLWRGDGRGSYIGSWFSLLCFGMLSGTRTCCLRIHFCDGMGLLKFG